MGLASPFPAGGGIAAAALAGAAPLAAYKYADQNIGPSQPVLQNDSDLSLAFVANGTYLFDGMIIYAAATAANYKATLAAIPGITFAVWSPEIYTGAGGTAFVQPAQILNLAATIVAGAQGTAQNQWLAVQGSVVMGALAGTLQWQFAQNVSDNSGCWTRAGSWLRAWKIA